MTTARTTHRWRGIVAVALLAGGVGVLLKRPSVLLLATAAVGFVLYPRLTTPPSPAFDISRDVAVDRPDHGEAVRVTVTLENTGDAILSDVRIVDGVPPMLAVADGSPRHAAVLPPGQSTTFTYRVRAKRGVHRFDPATVIVRDLAGAHEVETTVATETTIEVGAGVPEVPLRPQHGPRVADLVTDDDGAGIEFHRTRRYRHGDPQSHIDWQRFARTGELTTITYAEERTASVLLCLDARRSAHRTDDPEEPHAVSHSLGAIEQLFAALLETPHRVGLAALGPDFCWLQPGTGTEHAARARRLFASNPSLSAHQPREETTSEELDRQVTVLRGRLDAATQVLLFSPLPDDAIVEACLKLETSGNAVTVITPDVTTTETTGTRLALVERRARISTLRERDVPTVDWTPDRPLGTALLEAQERWSV